MEEELDLKQYWEIIRKRWKLVVAIPLIAAMISAGVSLFILPRTYEAVTTLIVGQQPAKMQQSNQMIDYNQLLANQQLAKTYAMIAKSRSLEENVINNLDLATTYDKLDKKIIVDSVDNTEVIEIKVDYNSPILAANIANDLASEFSQAAIKIDKVDSVSVVDKAVPPEKPISPKKTLNVLIAFVVGLMVSLGIAFLLEYLDNTFRTTSEVEKYLGLPVLGIIPKYDFDE